MVASLAISAWETAALSQDVLQDEDVRLFLRVAKGDETAYRRLVDRHAGLVLRYAWRFLGNRQDAEEIVQEVFLRVWRDAPRWSAGRARFSTWLYRVATNLCIDVKRRRRPLLMETVPEGVDAGPLADVQIAERERAVQIHACISSLPARQRTAILLCYFEGLSNRQAAEVLDVGVKALESLLTRGRATLKTQFNQLGIDAMEWTDEPPAPVDSHP